MDVGDLMGVCVAMLAGGLGLALFVGAVAALAVLIRWIKGGW